MIQEVWDQTGTPQNPVDWTDPDTWIDERLHGESARLAKRVWVESGNEVNPRYLQGSYFTINRYELLEADVHGIYRITDTGQRFLHDDPEVLAKLDRAEGLDELLSILSTKQRAMRGDLLPEWGAFLKEHSKFGSPSTIKHTFRRRIVNLVQRGYVDRDGSFYSISETGLEYLERLQSTGKADPRREVNRAVAVYNQSQRRLFRENLASMHPVQFEQLISDLLEAMGYEDVEVTKQSGDRGVDVIGTVQLGITSVTEVVQVKRHKGSIGRPVLDQLRGALPYHKAIRGTIITTGSFSKGCKKFALFPGTAPITLIDGERLIDLLVEHKVGIRRKELSLLEVDQQFFRTAPDDLREADE